jgi:hypothetical protein
MIMDPDCFNALLRQDLPFLSCGCINALMNQHHAGRKTKRKLAAEQYHVASCEQTFLAGKLMLGSLQYFFSRFNSASPPEEHLFCRSPTNRAAMYKRVIRNTKTTYSRWRASRSWWARRHPGSGGAASASQWRMIQPQRTVR